MSFDTSATKGHEVVLGYSPSMKVKANEEVACEPVYLGVHRRGPHDVGKKDLPLPSESDAMVAMTSALLPPQNRQIGPVLCSWWSEVSHAPYGTMKDVEHRRQCIDLALDCGIDIMGDAHTWSGEPEKVNALRGGDKIRHWSRVRVRQHFFPHYLDSPLVFDAPKSMSVSRLDERKDRLYHAQRVEQFA